MPISLNEQVQADIESKSLFNDKDGLLLAVSGGIDSMCLLHLLSKIHSGKIEVGHMNYQLRGSDSDKDEKLVRSVCERLRLKCHINKSPLDPNQSALQEEARNLRYAWLNKLKNERNLNYILTAHQLDDQIETALHHFIRGSGIKGLSGMSFKKNQIIRPLLDIPRSKIVDYQKLHNIPFREDDTNKESKYTRNFLRNEVLPQLRSHFKSAKTGLQTSLQNLRGESILLNKLLRDWVDNQIEVKDGYFHIPLIFTSYEAAIPSLLFHITNGRINSNEAHQLINAEQPGTVINKEEFSILKGRENLIIRPFPKQKINTVIKKPGIYKTPIGDFSIEIAEEVNYNKNPYSEYISTTKEIFPMQLRNWKEGDQFYPIGMKGHSKKLSDLFINEKMHQFEKEDIPILVQGNEIVWVIGLRLSEKYKFRGMDKFIYKLSFSRSTKDLRPQFFKHLF